MRFVYPLFAIFSLLFVGGCTPKSTVELIDMSEGLLIEHPDSALSLLRSVDRSTLRGPHARARYNLVLCEAMYHNGVDSDCDTLTRQLFDYYYLSDRHDERARAMYQHGWVKTNTCQPLEAIYALLESQRSLRYCNNPRLSGLVNGLLGFSYSQIAMYRAALDALRVSCEQYEIAGLEYHLLYSMYDMGEQYVHLREYDNAIGVLLDVVAKTEYTEYYDLHFDALITLCYAYLRSHDEGSANRYFERITPRLSYYDGLYRYYCLKAHLDIGRGDLVSARESLSAAKSCYCRVGWYVEEVEWRLLECENRLEESWAIRKSLYDEQEKAAIFLVNNTVSKALFESGEGDYQLVQRLHDRTKVIIGFGVLLVVLVLLIVGYLLRVRSRRRDLYVSTLLEQVESMRRDITMQSDTTQRLSDEVGQRDVAMSTMRRLLQDSFGRSLQDISELLGAYYVDGIPTVVHRQAVETIDRYVQRFMTSEDGYLAVESYVNLSYENIMVRLRTELPNWAERDYVLMCLIYADFSSSAICMFMGYDKNKLYRQKTRLKSKVTNSECESKELLLRHLK